MPIYEFACTHCNHRWDELLKFSDPDPATCPKCAKPNVQRYVSAAAFRLKGAGWYETDFKKEGDTKRHLASDSGAEAAKDASQSTETKAADAPKAASESSGTTASPSTSTTAAASAAPTPSNATTAKPD